MDLVLSGVDGLLGPVLGALTLLLLATVAFVVTRLVCSRVAVLVAPGVSTRAATAARLRPVHSDRVTDPRSHPLRPRAPGIA